MSNEQIDTADKNFLKRMDKFFAENWFPFAVGIFCFPLWCLLVAVFGFLVGIPVTKWHAVVAFALNFTSIAWACKWKWKSSLGHSSAFVVVLLFVAACTSPFVGGGYDTMTYHHPAAIEMKNGWNPVWFFGIYDHSGHPANPDIPEKTVSLYWTQHYAKADWIINAVLYAFSGNSNATVVSHGLWLIVTVIVTFVSFCILFRLPPLFSAPLSLVPILNPIIVGNFGSGLVDDFQAIGMTIIFFSLAGYLRSQDRRLLLFACGGIIVTTNLKFTGVIYIGLFLLVLLTPYFIKGFVKKKKTDTFLLGSLVMATLLSLVVGINPYIHNICRHISPFYPLVTVKKSEKAHDFMTPMLEKYSIKNATALQRFVLSYLVPFDEPPYTEQRTPQPITVAPEKIFTNRMGGTFGMGETFIIPLAFSIFAAPFIRRKDMWLFLAVWSTILIQPHSWFARYVPQLWIIPLIVLCSVLSQTEMLPKLKTRMRLMACLLIACYFACPYPLLKTKIFYVKKWMINVTQLQKIHNDSPESLTFHVSKTEPTIFQYTYRVSQIPDYFPGANIDHPKGVHLCYYLHSPVSIDRNSKYLSSFADVLRASENKTLLVSVRDEATTKLSEEIKQLFRGMGADIDKLKFRGAYAAVIQNGKVVAEKIDEKACNVEYRDPKSGRLFQLSSAGFTGGNRSFIKIDGKEYSPDARGFNVVSLENEKNGISARMTFDTFADENPVSVNLPKLTRSEIVCEIMKLRLRQLKRVWGQ